MARRTERLEAYLDTSAFIAFLDKSDSYHPPFKRLFSAPPPLVTSALVIAEGHGWFLRRYDRHRAAEFLAFLEALPALTVQAFDATELSEVRRIPARFGDQPLTLADAHGLVIMKDRRNAICWSADRHLGLTGGEPRHWGVRRNGCGFVSSTCHDITSTILALWRQSRIFCHT